MNDAIEFQIQIAEPRLADLVRKQRALIEDVLIRAQSFRPASAAGKSSSSFKFGLAGRKG